MALSVPSAPARSLSPSPASRPLRAWQQDAVAAVLAHSGDAFLASATPAAGKTTFGLRVAHQLLATGAVRRAVVLAPTAHIARQWAADAARYGIDLEPGRCCTPSAQRLTSSCSSWPTSSARRATCSRCPAA